MSDMPQGSGWWQASDGKWYPPELRPGPAEPAPQPTPVTQPPAAEQVPPAATAPPAAAEQVPPAATWTSQPEPTPEPAPVPAAAAAAAPTAAAEPAGPSRKWIPQTIIIVDIAILIITLGLVLLQG
jgi:hypothetical protein